MIFQESKTLETDKKPLIQPDFSMLDDLFVEKDEIFDGDSLIDDLAAVKSHKVLVPCANNMPQWQNAWWGEKAWLVIIQA
ncbi:MAG TPA: hypothetical protein DDZ80_16035 [Cyanobacteria bacterium UBA8803]|nr:hypothetical protein [Cyanobacteria bacterium UBA8803]